jgi:hypothetical protein
MVPVGWNDAVILEVDDASVAPLNRRPVFNSGKPEEKWVSGVVRNSEIC